MLELREVGLMTRLALGGYYHMSGDEMMSLCERAAQNVSFGRKLSTFRRYRSGAVYYRERMIRLRRAYAKKIAARAIVDASQPGDVRDEWIG